MSQLPIGDSGGPCSEREPRFCTLSQSSNRRKDFEDDTDKTCVINMRTSRLDLANMVPVSSSFYQGGCEENSQPLTDRDQNIQVVQMTSIRDNEVFDSTDSENESLPSLDECEEEAVGSINVSKIIAATTLFKTKFQVSALCSSAWRRKEASQWEPT